jgi:hypothetical protein
MLVKGMVRFMQKLPIASKTLMIKKLKKLTRAEHESANKVDQKIMEL